MICGGVVLVDFGGSWALSWFGLLLVGGVVGCFGCFPGGVVVLDLRGWLHSWLCCGLLFSG